MPTTANFSLEYPDDNSSVDIAGHFETLADDVDEAINTRLALTGGTLTGALVGTLTTDSSSSTTGAFKTAGGMGIAKALYVGTTLNVTGTTTLTGATTLTGDLTISKAQPYIFLDKTNANWQGIAFRTGTSNRWALQVNNVSESSTATGSDLVLSAYNNSGSTLSTPLTITRSTGAVTLTGTLNGKVVNDLVTGPASATDNALVRFDNTTGKVVQNSGITVDDSGYITSDVTMSKASPILSVSASTTTTASIYFDNAAAGSYGRFLFRVNGSKRWECGRDGTAEAGANAGSDFYISNYSDASAAIGIPFKIARSTGKTTLGYVGATAGLELGTSGPRVMSGTGSPEGVVTAPVGSTWIDTNATTGAIKWIKASGTGNTGWVVEYGDTGWRTLTAESLASSWAWGTFARVRRVGNTVELALALNSASASAGYPYTLPSGFRPKGDTYFALFSTVANFTGTPYGKVYPDGSVQVVSYSTATYVLQATYTTANAWPTSLVGSAI